MKWKPILIWWYDEDSTIIILPIDGHDLSEESLAMIFEKKSNFKKKKAKGDHHNNNNKMDDDDHMVYTKYRWIKKIQSCFFVFVLVINNQK